MPAYHMLTFLVEQMEVSCSHFSTRADPAMTSEAAWHTIACMTDDIARAPHVYAIAGHSWTYMNKESYLGAVLNAQSALELLGNADL